MTKFEEKAAVREQKKLEKKSAKIEKNNAEQEQIDLKTQILSLAFKKAKKKIIIAVFICCIVGVISECFFKDIFNPILAYVVICFFTYLSTGKDRKDAEMEILNNIDNNSDNE